MLLGYTAKPMFPWSQGLSFFPGASSKLFCPKCKKAERNLALNASGSTLGKGLLGEQLLPASIVQGEDSIEGNLQGFLCYCDSHTTRPKSKNPTCRSFTFCSYILQLQRNGKVRMNHALLVLICKQDVRGSCLMVHISFYNPGPGRPLCGLLGFPYVRYFPKGNPARNLV